MNDSVYVKLKKPIVRGQHLDTLDELRVRVSYQKGGINYFTGDIESSGVYVSLTPVHRNNGIVGQTIDGNLHNSGYKVLIKELGRKSQKQINLVAEAVLPKAEQIADYYSEGQHQAVLNLLRELFQK
jgi:hypothetical protein